MVSEYLDSCSDPDTGAVLLFRVVDAFVEKVATSKIHGRQRCKTRAPSSAAGGSVNWDSLSWWMVSSTCEKNLKSHIAQTQELYFEAFSLKK